MIEVCFFYLTLFQKWFLACCFNNLFFFREFFVDDEASDGKEEADGFDDVVPWVGAEWEVVWCDGLPHVEPWVEGYDSDADEADVEPATIPSTVAAFFQHKAWCDGDEDLGENPEFPHGAVMKFKAQQIEPDKENDKLEDDVAKHDFCRCAGFPVDVLFVGHGAL